MSRHLSMKRAVWIRAAAISWRSWTSSWPSATPKNSLRTAAPAEDAANTHRESAAQTNASSITRGTLLTNPARLPLSDWGKQASYGGQVGLLSYPAARRLRGAVERGKGLSQRHRPRTISRRDALLVAGPLPTVGGDSWHRRSSAAGAGGRRAGT